MSKNKYLKKIYDITITIIIFIIGKLFALLPLKLNNFLCRKLGSFAYLISRKRRKQALENLFYAFPDYTTKQRKNIAKQSFQNLSINLGEIFIIRTINENNLEKIIHYNNVDTLKEIQKRNKGILFLSGHFGNWEILAYSMGILAKTPITIIVKPQSNNYIDNIINKIRTYSGNKIVSMYSAARTIVDVIQKGKSVALLVDQAATKDKDIYVDFFNRPASTYKVLAKLALKFNIPIIITFAIRQKNNKYVADIKELDFSDLKYNQEDIIELTKRHVKILEDVIRQYPEQWTWMHKRWKHLPPNKL